MRNLATICAVICTLLAVHAASGLDAGSYPNDQTPPPGGVGEPGGPGATPPAEKGTLLGGESNPTLGEPGVPVVAHGSFGGAPYARPDAGAVSAYKAEAAAIAAGGYTSDYEYKTLEAVLISFDGHSTYVTDRGGCIYILTVITGLEAGDIVHVDNDYFYNDGTGYASFWNQDPYWIEINPYTHASGDTILNWLIYFEPDGEGTYTLIIGSGEYNLAEHTDNLTEYIGHQYELTRDVTVWRGASLVNPLTSSRGYTYSNSGITGGTEVASSSLDQTDMTYVGTDQVYVDAAWAGSANGDVVGGHLFGQEAFTSVQQGIDGVSGSTINVAAGTYDETLNIENKTDLSIIGESAATTIVKSSSTIGWNVGGYGTNRQTVVRIVNSTGIVLQNLTIDCDLIKGNNRFGITGWDSSVSIDACVVQNMSAPDTSGYYAELGSYFKAPGYSDASRAAVSITNSTFMNAGRVGVVTHDYIDATIENNTFGKTIDDFGYGIEVGSMSTGVVRGNTFYGFDLPAASDGSESAGIYIENAFTASSPSLTKTVLVENNEIYGCQYGMWIGNGYNGYAGDVDIVVTLNNNNFHDNVEGGAWIQDEDASAGSSVSVSGGGNTWADNGDHGIRIYTAGDGDVSINLTGETISGNDTGVLVEDAAPAGSSYSVSITGSTITGNTSYGVNNTVSGLTVDASGNWWGSTDAAAVAAAASGDVDYSPWLGAAPGTTPMTWYVASIGTIQEAVDAAGAGDTVIVTPGTYVEQVNIGKDLTLQGSGSDTIVQAPASMTPLFTTSSPHYPVLLAQGAVVAVKDLVVDGAGRGNGHSRFVGIAYRNAGGAVTNVEITDVRDTPFSGSQHGVAMYLYNNDGQSRSFALTGCDIHDFQKNAMALNADAVTPVDVTVQNCTITGYGATTVTAQNGIQIWGDVMTGLVDNNVVSGIAYDNTLNPTKWVATSILNYYADLDITNNEVSEGHLGIYNIDGAGQITGNTFSIEKVGVSAYGIVATDPPAAVPAPYGEESKAEGGVLENGAMLNVTIADNYLRLDGDDNTATYGIEADAGYGPDDLALTVQNNIVSGFDVGIELWQCESDCDTGTFTSILAENNSLVGNTYGLRSNVTAITVNAEDNWWGDPLGPRPVGPGSGDAVSENADYDPWLGKPAQLNALYLQPTPTSFYIKTGETMVVHMNVANLQQNVNACQAMLGYSSTYFEDPSSGAVAAGGGVWDQLIWDSWSDSSGIPGEIDTAIGVNAQGATGTNADGKVAIITLTAGTTEGVTRMIFREDLDPDPGLIKSTFLADINNGPVWPAKVDSTNVYIDGSDPTIGNLAATQNSTDVLDCAATTVQGTVNISVDASDALAGLDGPPILEIDPPAPASPDSITGAASEKKYYFDGVGQLNLTAGNKVWALAVPDIDVSALSAGGAFNVSFGDEGSGSGWEKIHIQLHKDHTGAGGHLLQAYDKWWDGGPISSHGFNAGDVPGTLDLRVIMQQNGDGTWHITPQFRLPAGEWTTFFDGSYDTVEVFDLTVSMIQPQIDAGSSGTVAFSPGVAFAYVDENPAATYNYEYVVDSTTPNGTASMAITATDNSGNEVSVTGTLCINKNAITGTVHIDSGSNAAYSFDRNVVFTATNNGGTVLKTWTVLVSFSNAAQVAAGTYSLTNVPAGTSNLSAKTAWSLREKKAVTFDDDDQAVVDFTGADMMRGGDINGSNSVNILDYSTLKIHWVSQDPVADINGDTDVNAVDYNLMKKYWFQVGDPQ